MFLKLNKLLCSINYKLLLTIWATLFIPVLYRTLRFFWLGTMPDTWSFSIAANMQWINVLFEVLEEAFILPLFFVIGAIIKNNDETIGNRKIIGKIYMIVAIYLTCIILFISLAPQMLDWMSNSEPTSSTIGFVRNEFANRFFVMFTKIGAVVLILKNEWKILILLLCIETFMQGMLDTFMISTYSFSANLGARGIGYDDTITYGTLSITYSIIMFRLLKVKWVDFLHPIWNSNTRGGVQFVLSGLESFIRNAFFIFYVVKVVAKLENQYNQGDFWVTNSFIWDWLLLPILAIGQYMNRQSATVDKDKSLLMRFGGVSIIVGITICLWFILIPAYDPFIEYVLNNPNHELISHLAIISLGFYVPFAFNEMIDKALFGEGRAGFMLVQSIITNVVIYIPIYYSVDSMTIDQIALMFAGAIGTDSLITFIMFFLYEKGKLDLMFKWIDGIKLKITRKHKNENI